MGGGQRGRPTLFGSLDVEHGTNDGEDDVGQPDGQEWVHATIDGKGLGYSEEEDVDETEDQTNANVFAHAAAGLARREADANEGEDEGGKGCGSSFIEFYGKLLGVANVSFG